MKSVETAIARIFSSSGSIVGLGFLISRNRIMTCAHVVADAVGISRDEPTPPQQTISVDFPLVDDNRKCTAEVVVWLPSRDGTDDIAVLELNETAPESTTHAHLIAVENPWGLDFGAYGFPQYNPKGVWASGKAKGKIEGNRIQVEDVEGTSYFIEPGFSGSPVYCDNTEISGVIGMVVSAEADASIKAGFMIPSQVLLTKKDQIIRKQADNSEAEDSKSPIDTTDTASHPMPRIYRRDIQPRVVYIGRFEEMKSVIQTKRVFVAHRFFGGDANALDDYRLFLQDGLDRIGYAPRFNGNDSGTLLETICQDIINTEAGIYDVSGYNANVLIELGMSIGLNKPTVVIAEDDSQPLIAPLQQLNPLRYESPYDLPEQIGSAVQEQIQKFRQSGMKPRYCAACGLDCIARKYRQSPEDEYVLVGTDSDNVKKIHYHLNKAVKNFNLTLQQLDGNFNLTVCRWVEEVKRSRIVFFHSKGGDTRHSGIDNATTMVRTGIAIGLGVAWRMILQGNDDMPTDLKGYKYVSWDRSPRIFEATLNAAVRTLLGEARPYGGMYDPLVPIEAVENHADEVFLIDAFEVSRSPIFMAPPLPENYVSRSNEIDVVVEQIIQSNRPSLSGLVSGISGMGGAGKTALAIAVCHDERVKDAFADGIVWFSLGEKPDILEEIRSVYNQIMSRGNVIFSSDGWIEQAQHFMAEQLQQLSALIVFDDVWSVDDVLPFVVDNSKAAYLVTTRNAEVIQKLNAKEFHIDILSENDAVELLISGLGVSEYEIKKNQDYLKDLIQKAGYLAITISRLNATIMMELAGGLSFDDAVIRTADRFPDRWADSWSNDSLGSLLGAAIEQLTDDRRNLFQQLSVFVEDADIPVSTIANLWQLDQVEAEEILNQLNRQSLLNLADSYVRLHDLVRSFLQTDLTDELQLHARILDAWNDPYSLPNEYAWRYYIYHAVKAERTDQAKELLKDVRWLQAKLDVTDVDALIADYGLFENDTDLSPIAELFEVNRSELEASDKSINQLFEALTDETAELRSQRTHKLFLAYHSLDAFKVDKITHDLSQLRYDDGVHRYATWQDKNDILPGTDWRAAIVDAISDCDIFVFFISEESLKSKSCLAEVEYARRRNRPVIPVVLEGEFTFNTLSGKYDINYWEIVPDWLRDVQFLFYTGADFYKSFQSAVQMLERNWSRDIMAPSTSDPRTIQSISEIIETAQHLEKLVFEVLQFKKDGETKSRGLSKLWQQLEGTDVEIPSGYTEIVNQFWTVRNRIVYSGADEPINANEINQIVETIQPVIAWLEEILVDQLVEWFFRHYEDPAHGVPYESSEGGYQYFNGGPYEADDVLQVEFPDIPESIIEQAARTIENDGHEWVRIGDY